MANKSSDRSSGGQYFESNPSKLLFDFSTVPVYPSPRLTETDIRIHEEFLEWFRRPQRHHHDRVLRQLERQQPSAFRAPRLGPGNLDELAFTEPIRAYDDAFNTITEVGGDNPLDTVAKLCAKNNDNVYTFRTTDTSEFVRDDFDDVIRMFSESLVGSRLPLQHWGAKYPKTIILFPQYVPPAQDDAYPGHYWLLVLECATGQTYRLDSLDRDIDHGGLTFARERMDSRLAATLYRSGIATNVRVPHVIAAHGSLQGDPDEANSFLYTARWIQLLNERYYQPFLDLNFRHDRIFERESGRQLKLHSRFTALQSSPLSCLTDLQHDTLDSCSVDLNVSVVAEAEEKVLPGDRKAGRRAEPLEQKDMEFYRSWLHGQLHQLQVSFIEQSNHQQESTSTSDQLVHDLRTFQPHVSTLVASHAVTNLKAAGVLVRLPHHADSCTTSSANLAECSASVVTLLPGSKVILGDIGTVKHYRHGQLTAPLESDGQMADVVFRQSDGTGSNCWVASNIEKVMIGVTPDGNAYARNMTRGMHQDAKGDADARMFQGVDKEHLVDQRPLDWEPQVTVDGLDIRRLPAVGPLHRISRIAINDCVWLWISPTALQIPEPKIPPFVPETFNAEHLTALVEDLGKTVNEADTFGLLAIQEIESFLDGYRRLGGALDLEAVDDICIRITRLRNEQRKGLAAEHGNDEMAIDIHEHTFLQGMRAPPTHRRPLRPSWQRLLGGGRTFKFTPNPETKKGYYGPVDWMGGAQITREAARLPVYTDGHSPQDTQLARILDLHELEELQRLRPQTKQEKVPLDLDAYVENTAETHMAQRHFAYSPMRSDNRPPRDDDGGVQMEAATVQYFHDQVLYPLIQRDDMDCMLFGRGSGPDYLYQFLSGIPAAITSVDWRRISSDSGDSFFPDGKIRSTDYLELCCRKRYWLFLAPKTIPPASTIPLQKSNHTPMWVRTPTMRTKEYVQLPVTDDMVRQVNGLKPYKDTTKQQWWKAFISHFRESTGLTLPFEKGTCGYIIDDRLKITAGDEIALLSKEVLSSGGEWHPLANAHDVHVLLTHKIYEHTYQSDDDRGLLHITFYSERPQTAKAPSPFHKDIFIRGDRDNSHWRTVIYDSYNGETWLHDPGAASGKIEPLHWESVFLTGLTTFLQKYNWPVVMETVGIDRDSRPFPVVPTSIRLLPLTNLEQLTGWACGYLALGVILNFFLDYRTRQPYRSDVTRSYAGVAVMLHKDHDKPKEERMGVFLESSLQAYRAGRTKRLSSPSPIDKIALVDLPSVEWKGRDQKAKGPDLDLILNSYQQANRLPLSLLLDTVHHEEARIRAVDLLEQAGAILFAVNRHEDAGDFGKHEPCQSHLCRHLIDILPVAPGQCVILTEDPVEPEARKLSPEEREKARNAALLLRRSHQLLVGNTPKSGFVRYSAALWQNLEDAQRDADEHDIPVMVNFVNILDKNDKKGVNTTLRLPNIAFIRLGSRVWCWVRRQNHDGGEWEKNINGKRLKQVEASALRNRTITISALREEPALETLRWFIREATNNTRYRIYCELHDLLPGVNEVKSALYRSPVYGRETQKAPKRKRANEKEDEPEPDQERFGDGSARKHSPLPVNTPPRVNVPPPRNTTPPSIRPVPSVRPSGSTSARNQEYRPTEQKKSTHERSPTQDRPHMQKRGHPISSIILQKSTGNSGVSFEYQRAVDLCTVESASKLSILKELRQRGARRRRRFRIKRRRLDGKGFDVVSDEYDSDDSIDHNLERVQPFGIRPRRRLRRDPDWQGPAMKRPALYEYSSDGDTTDPEHADDPRKQDQTIDQRAYNRKRRRLNKAAEAISNGDAERNTPVVGLVRRTHWVDLGGVSIPASSDAAMTPNEVVALAEVVRLRAQKTQLERRLVESLLNRGSGESVPVDERLRDARARVIEFENELQTLRGEHAMQMVETLQSRRSGDSSGSGSGDGAGSGPGVGGEGTSEAERRKLLDDIQKQKDDIKKLEERLQREQYTCKELEQRLKQEQDAYNTLARDKGLSQEELERRRQQSAKMLARNKSLENESIEGLRRAIQKGRALHRRQLERAKVEKLHEAEREALRKSTTEMLMNQYMASIDKTKPAFQALYPKGTNVNPTCPVCLKGANSAHFGNHLHGYQPKVPDPKRKPCGLAGLDRFHRNGAPASYGKNVPSIDSEHRAEYEAAVAEATRPPEDVQRRIDEQVTQEMEARLPRLREKLRVLADDFTDNDEEVDISDIMDKTKQDLNENFTAYVTVEAPGKGGGD